MQRYFMIIEETGCYRLYSTEYWKYESILSEININEKIKEITKEFRNSITRDSLKVIVEKINDFIKIDFFNELESNIISNFFYKDTCDKEEGRIFTQQEKDIKLLAEFNKSLIEAMPLPSEGHANPMLIKMQEIIDRYS